MLAPVLALLSALTIFGTDAPARRTWAVDSLDTYRAELVRALRRTHVETTQDVASRLERVTAPSAYDSLHHALLHDAQRWATAEARYYRYIGAEPTTCLYGPQGYGCGDPERRMSSEATALTFEVRVARDGFTRTWLVIKERLRADIGAEATHGRQR